MGIRKGMVGLTKSAGWQVGVSKTVNAGTDEVWNFLVGPGLPRWLGVDQLGPVGSRWNSSDAEGEVRSCTRPIRVRVTHREHDSDRETTIQVALRRATTGTTIVFHQERMGNAEERERARDHWTQVAEDIAQHFA